jgi:hypothetical protein
MQCNSTCTVDWLNQNTVYDYMHIVDNKFVSAVNEDQ